MWVAGRISGGGRGGRVSWVGVEGGEEKKRRVESLMQFRQCHEHWRDRAQEALGERGGVGGVVGTEMGMSGRFPLRRYS